MASDYERLRQRLDEQLLADFRTAYAAYLVQVRACETLAASQGEIAAGSRPPLSLNGALADALGPAEITLVLAPAPAPAALPPAPAQPAPPPPPARRRRPKTGDFEVYAGVVAALGQMPEVFDRKDLLRVLPMKPHRSTLHRVLEELEYKEKLIVLAERGSGSTPARYRKVAPEPPASG